MPYPTYPEDDEDFIGEDLPPQIPRSREKKKGHRPRTVKYEFNVPENYKDFQQLGIPTDIEARLAEFLRRNNVPSHEVLAHYEAKGNAIASWLNPQVYELERVCLRTGTLVENFQSLEESEVLVTQLKNATSTVKVLQAKLDDQLFPWLTKSNLKKYGPLVLTFALIVIATFIWFKFDGNSSSVPNNESPVQSSQPSSPTPTSDKPRADQ